MSNSSPASATCFRIRSALARLTTGPRFVSGDVGSPSLYFYSFNQTCERRVDSKEYNLDNISDFGDKSVVNIFVNINALKVGLEEFRQNISTKRTSIAQKLWPELNIAPTQS